MIDLNSPTDGMDGMDYRRWMTPGYETLSVDMTLDEKDRTRSVQSMLILVNFFSDFLPEFDHTGDRVFGNNGHRHRR